METVKGLVTAAEIAALLSVKEKTVMEWARKGKIPRVCPSPKIIRFDPEAVLRAVKGAGR